MRSRFESAVASLARAGFARDADAASALTRRLRGDDRVGCATAGLTHGLAASPPQSGAAALPV